MSYHYDFRPMENVVDFTKKVTFTSKFKPKEHVLLELLRGKNKELQEKALLAFHKEYSEELESINGLTIWLSGTLDGYKLEDVRVLVKEVNAKIVTRETKKLDVIVLAKKTKIEELPENKIVISAIAFVEVLKALENQLLELGNKEERDEELISLLLSKELEKVEEAFSILEEQGISLKVLPLMFALFKVHKEKHIRSHAKTLILKESNKTAKDAMLFCEKRNFLNAKYTVGMEELEKIKGFNIELFLYYMVREQKNNLGKEYLASLDSDWTQKFIEEQELLNQKELELYGKAGRRFVHAKRIESFVVYALSPVLWEMTWLKSLEIIDIKQRIVLPKVSNFSELETLTLETKELTLAGDLGVKSLLLRKCKELKIEENFKLNSVENITLDACGFDLMLFKSFLENAEMPQLKKIEIHDFIAYKIPKDWEEQLHITLPSVELIFV